MCVQLRPVIKDDSMLQAVFKVCLKYTSTQNTGSVEALKSHIYQRICIVNIGEGM